MVYCTITSSWRRPCRCGGGGAVAVVVAALVAVVALFVGVGEMGVKTTL